ncbi:hypothetical protein [Arthrobacter sp. 4R501]|uniref:hypothetical protein n=1 Tax=Arthrobacter sp. 4R501 TaxID=2058886 RepID=UPI0034D6390D
MTHPGFTSLSDSLIAQQVLGAEPASVAVGADPRPSFRFPYGNGCTNPLSPEQPGICRRPVDDGSTLEADPLPEQWRISAADCGFVTLHERAAS